MSYLKIGPELPSKEEVASIAASTGLDTPGVIGRLYLMWTHFNTVTRDGVLVTADVTADVTRLDAIVTRDGFCEAMVKAGWMVLESNKISLPNFTRHQGRTAKQRDADRDRQRRKREKDRSRVTISQSRVMSRVSHGCDLSSPSSSPSFPPTPPYTPPPYSPNSRSAHESDADLFANKHGLLVELTTDEMDAALRFDPKGELAKLTGTSWKAVVDMCGMCNSGAEKFTPESLAEAYLAEATRRELRVFRNKAQETAPKLSSSTLRSDLESFVRLAKGSPERNNLVLRSAAKPKVNTMHAPCSWWREICAELYDGSGLTGITEWIELPLSAREGIWSEFHSPVHTRAVAARHV